MAYKVKALYLYPLLGCYRDEVEAWGRNIGIEVWGEIPSLSWGLAQTVAPGSESLNIFMGDLAQGPFQLEKNQIQNIMMITIQRGGQCHPQRGATFSVVSVTGLLK